MAVALSFFSLRSRRRSHSISTAPRTRSPCGALLHARSSARGMRRCATPPRHGPCWARSERGGAVRCTREMRMRKQDEKGATKKKMRPHDDDESTRTKSLTLPPPLAHALRSSPPRAHLMPHPPQRFDRRLRSGLNRPVPSNTGGGVSSARALHSAPRQHGSRRSACGCVQHDSPQFFATAPGGPGASSCTQRG